MDIDKIFIVNLENRKDRKESMLNELNKQEITNYEFFKAIRPTLDEVNEWNPNYCEHVRNSIPKANFDNYRIGCLGCLKSHTEIMKIALDRGYKTILILEDDILFINPFEKIYSYADQVVLSLNGNYNYGIIYLSGSHLGKTTKMCENVIRVRGTHTTGSYIINEEAMRYIVDNITSFPKEVDVFYVEHIQSTFNCYCFVPHITTQADGFSDIQQKVTNYSLSYKNL